MICSPCVPSLAATKKVLSFHDHPDITYVYVSYMEYGRTHKHSLRRARQTHEKIRMNKASRADSSRANYNFKAAYFAFLTFHGQNWPLVQRPPMRPIHTLTSSQHCTLPHREAIDASHPPPLPVTHVALQTAPYPTGKPLTHVGVVG